MITCLVETTSDINRGLLDDVVYDLWQGSEEIGGVDLGVEEDLGCKEAFIAHIYRVFLAGNNQNITQEQQ